MALNPPSSPGLKPDKTSRQCHRRRSLIHKRLASVGPYDLRIKHLYHDREEVTAYLALKR